MIGAPLGPSWVALHSFQEGDTLLGLSETHLELAQRLDVHLAKLLRGESQEWVLESGQALSQPLGADISGRLLGTKGTGECAEGPERHGLERSL